MAIKKFYKTVVISDVHLGAQHSKLKEVTKFLNSVRCERLVLDGDIIDGWQLKKNKGKWTVMESAFFHAIMKMMEQDSTDVIYVVGNHDDFLAPIVPSSLFNIQVVNEYLIEDSSRRYVIIHGHAFDSITSGMRWLAKLGDVAYNLLLKINYRWNRARESRGKDGYSFSKAAKQAVKNTVNMISGFEADIASFAAAKRCDGIICGHIHHPEDKILKGGIRYLNSGDWVETLSAVVESTEDEWSVVYYKDFFDDGLNNKKEDQ